ncbi:alkaline phosphatase [Silicimonas algicola]|uniref:Phytase-like protein with esterase activity n=1 Tax=Silicimonas algicola TaxID=1826607 RepID=A0A316GD82_9RHOB|nr:esterase-like activity of phytase family protein [Silicimonas algicola]AZQ66523.1 alkaline phosphatase [Silicimonas algicola]PWK58864.1 phytase-like protein with esterase activity [Silicimonas algicola]
MTSRLLAAVSALSLCAGGALAETAFNRIASFPVASNLPEGTDAGQETSSEIIAATEDGMTLVYTDSPFGVVGFVDITDPAAPAPLGVIEMGGEPTSVVVAKGFALAGVNTSDSFANPSGQLAVIDIAGRSVVATCDLGGQPDSIALAPDGSFLSIAIENERDEEAGDGRVGQMPAGFLVMVDLGADGQPDCGSLKTVDLTGLAEVAPEDPEPEFVDINEAGETVVTLQENNHIVVVARDGSVTTHFPAGSVDLEGVDTGEEGALTFDGEISVPREPDSVKWIDADHFATANEGDMDGGSRGWTVFAKDGTVVWDAGTSFEYAVAEIGHYPEGRSGNKGVEPESVGTGTFGGTPMVFIGSERGSVVGVYDATDAANPVLTQLLPSGVGPEGFVAIPSRDLFVSANETDLGEDGAARSHVMIYAYGEGAPSYPMLTSAGLTQENGAPVGWGAISGMAADADGSIWAVSDSVYGMQPSIFRIDASQSPARITEVIRITRDGAPAQKLDLEGIALDGEGGFWVASEGRTDRLIPHALYHVGADGEIEEEIALPKELLAVERRFGFEGIAKVGDTLWMAMQREWDDDPENHAKLVAYNIESGEWGAVHYPKAAPASGWVGLSEITVHGDHAYVVERDNLMGDLAVTKIVTRVPLAEMVPAPLGGPLPVVTKETVRDLLPDLVSTGGYVLDKVEGLAIMEDGTVWVSTDNDGVDDHSGETMFWSFKAD